jgi:hypothetical protein
MGVLELPGKDKEATIEKRGTTFDTSQKSGCIQFGAEVMRQVTSLLCQGSLKEGVKRRACKGTGEFLFS